MVFDGGTSTLRLIEHVALGRPSVAQVLAPDGHRTVDALVIRTTSYWVAGAGRHP
jgi:hypothetical protein